MLLLLLVWDFCLESSVILNFFFVGGVATGDDDLLCANGLVISPVDLHWLRCFSQSAFDAGGFGVAVLCLGVEGAGVSAPPSRDMLVFVAMLLEHGQWANVMVNSDESWCSVGINGKKGWVPNR